jgi:hypothetical protein
MSAANYEGDVLGDVQLQDRLKESTFLERLLDERGELAERIEKLKLFITTNAGYKSLTNEHQNLLEDQLEAMETYESVLIQRLTLLNKQNQL